jgi:predicted transposase YbfD/YdcC
VHEKRRWNQRIARFLKNNLGGLRLDEVDDPRDPRGLRWGLDVLLTTVVVTMIAGAKSLLDVERMTTEMSEPSLRLLGIRRRLPDTTARNVLCEIEPSELRARLYAEVRMAHRRKALEPEDLPFGVAAMDGKGTALPSCDDHYVQRQTASEGPLVGVMRTMTAALVSSRAKVCLDASPIPAATNEMGHFATALDELCVAYGSIGLFQLVTYDSGACSRANAQHVRDKGLDYFFALKGTQPTLEAEAHRLLAGRAPSTADATSEDVRNGHVVVRRVYLTDEMAGFDDWEHLHTVLRVQSETRDAGGKVVAGDERYFICNLPRSTLKNAQWLHIARIHWGVENNVHNTLDTVFEEDDHPWIEANPKGALVVALLRRIALNLLILFRTVTQRSDERRATPWRDLVRNVWLALVRIRNDDLCGELYEESSCAVPV